VARERGREGRAREGERGAREREAVAHMQYVMRRLTMLQPHVQSRARTVAKVLSTLPANLMTTAVQRAPTSWTSTSSHVDAWKPCSRPCLSTCRPSICHTAIACRGMANRASWTLRIQREVLPLVNIFSRKTPAKPESVAAASAAHTPSSGEAPVGELLDFASWDCTRMTPPVSSTKESHWTGLKERWRSTTVKKAVESDLSW
jgi:hypothetical protein